jgi:C-terminal processing protease CtpA/Prc
MSAALKAFLLLSFGMSGVSALAVQQAPDSPAADPANSEGPVTAAEARRTALDLAGILEENYVSPDVASRYAAALRTKANAGGYDGAASAAALAEMLTADLRAVAPDNHLRVTPRRAGGGGPVMVRRAPGMRPARPEGAPPPIEEARRLAPGIAYIRFTEFPGDPEVAAAAAKFMAEHADAESVIIDIRTHRGGTLAEMDAMLPFLYPKETTLLQMDTRASVDTRTGGGEAGSLRRVAGPDGVVRREHFVRPHASEQRLFDAKLFLLTSGFTASAAEHFALALKRTKRATLIGEQTAGAGNFGGMRPVGDRFAAFVPVGMTRDPETGTRFEGNGLKPDIEVPAERALVEALVRSGVAPAEAERLSAEVHPKGPMRRPASMHR